MRIRNYLAYTLIEILVTVSVIGAIGTGAYLVVQSVREQSATTKLEQDVRAVNQALKVYQTHGGRIPSGLTGDEVLARLRRKAATERHAGLKGSLIDPRMTIRWQSGGETEGSVKRAYWNDSAKIFEIAESGSEAGVKEFYLGEMPEPLPAGVDEEGNATNPNVDDRKSTMDFAQNKWVWDSGSDEGGVRESPTIAGTGGVDPGVEDSNTSGDARPLTPPNFSEVTGRFDIAWFPQPVTLTLPSGISPSEAEIYFHVTGGPWTRYAGAVSVQPAMTLYAKTVSLNPDKWLDSGERSERYDLISMKLEIAGSFPRPGYNFRELGGTMQGGGAAPQPPHGTVSVTNIADVQPEHLSSSKFQIYWTVDGSDPANSGSRIAGAPFEGSYDGTQLPVTLQSFNVATGAASIRVRAVALDTSLFQNSEELVLTLNAEKLTLPATTLSVANEQVVMAPVADPATLPAGARVFYTENAGDPGDNGNGEPSSSSAVLYGGPVTYPSGLTEYMARTYPPVEYKVWFTTGAPGTIGTGTTPDGFYFATTGGERNLYQFDASSGASIVRTSECLFPPAAVAFLGDTGRVYYIEQAAGNWQLGRYDLSSGAHSPAGGIAMAGLDYTPGQQPKNLVGYNNSLYYVAENTDDLVRVDFLPNGSVRSQYKFADLADDLIAFHNVGDIAADTTGTLFVSAENAWATYNLKSMNGFTVPVNNPSWVYSGIVTGATDQILGVRTTEPDKFYDVSKGSSTGGAPVTFTPARSFDDFAGPLSPVPFQMPPGHYALSPGTDDVLRLNLDSGRQYTYVSNLGIQPSALAADNAGGVLYALGTDPASPGSTVLVRISIASGEVTPLGSLNAGTFEYIPQGVPNAMVWYAGSLYYLDGTDDLVMVTVSGNAVTAQAKVADILEGVSIHPILGKVDGMTIGPDGQLYISSSDHQLLVSYDIANRAGFNVIRDNAPSSYHAITYRADQQMFGVPSTSGATSQQLFTIDDNSGTQAFAKNIVPPVSISDITGIFDGAPTPVNAEYFAIDGTSSRIYRFDPATGLNAILTASAPYTMGAIAYDGENQRVYYVRRGSTEIGSYSLATGSHTSAGNLSSSSLTASFTTATSPENLTFFNGALYFVPPNSDDLIRIDLNQSNTIADVWKEADINANVPFATVGDLAVDADGYLYLATSSGFGRFDMKTLTGYTALSTGTELKIGALFSAGGNSLFGVTVDEPSKLQTVNPANGETAFVANNSPLRNFIDTASAQARVSVQPVGGAYYASAAGRNTIYSLNVTTGSLRPVTATCPVRPEALAYDSDRGMVFYTENTGSGSNIGLYQYDLTTQRHTFAGNLAASGLGYPISSSPRNLVYFAGELYCIPAGDDLVRLNFTAGTVSSLTKFADISGNTRNIGNAGAFTVDNTGIGWVSQDSSNLLAKFNFYTRSGYSEVNTTDARMSSLVFSAANTLYGTHDSTRSVLHTVSQTTGARTVPVNTAPSLSIRDISGNNSRPRPPLPQCYAVGGDNTTIYQFDPATGVTYPITTTAAFNLQTLARDPVNNVLYYLENAASNWRLGRYAVSTNTHTVIEAVGNQNWAYPTLNAPQNLFFYGGHLYYIASGSDDLVQITLNTSGTDVLGVVKAADITEDGVNLGVVGDVAVDGSGRAWVATGNAVIGHFSMVTLSGWTQLSSAQPNYSSLLYTTSGSLYGSHSGGVNNIYSVDSSSGAANYIADTFPQITFWDMAGHEVSVPYSRSNSLWAIAEDSGRLGEFLNWNLPNVSARHYGTIRYLNNGVATSFTGGYGIESFALTASGTAYFVRNKATVINGITYKRPLFSFETSTLTYGGSAPVAAFVGDLELAFSSTGAVVDSGDTDEATGIAIGPDQRLWVLYNKGNSTVTDQLFRINSFSVNSQGALDNVSLMGSLTGDAESVTSGQDLAFVAGQLHVADDADDKIYTVNHLSAAITGVFSSDTGTRYEGLNAFGPTGEVIASNTDSGDAEAETVRRIRTGTGNDSSRFNYLTLSSNALQDIEGLSFSAGSLSGGNTAPAPYFAVNRTNSIYRVDPQSGTVTVLNSAAPFTLEALTYNQVAGIIYYIQNSNTTIQLGSYNLASGTHTILGDLKTTGTFRPSVRPQHLVYYQGDLFYIAGNGAGQSFLVRVRISPSAVLSQDSLTRLSSTASWTVTAAALDDTGRLYFREGANLRSYDLRRLGNLSAVTSTSASYDALLYATQSGSFYGVRSTSASSVESVNMSTGTGSNPVVTSPVITITDMSGGHNAPPQLWVNTNFYAVGGNNQDIYVIDPANAQNTLKTTTSLMNSIAAIAADPAGDKAYYIQQGSPYTLAVYDRATGTHTQLAQLANTGTSRPASQPDNLMWFNGHLYWLQSNSDNLYKIELRSNGTYSDTFQVADIANNEETAFGTVGDLAVDSNGVLFISGSNRFAKYNLDTLDGYTVLALNPAQVWAGLMVNADGVTLLGVKASEPGNLYTVSSTDGSGTIIGAFDAVRTIGDLGSPQVPVTSVLPGQRYFITQGQNSIFRIDLNTGRSYRVTSQLPYPPAGIAHDFTGNTLYVTGYTGSSVAAPGTVRLVSFNLSSGQPADLASLSSGWTYNTTAMPQALLYAQNAVWYVPPQTDDLVKVTLTSGVPSAQTKAADIAGGANLGDIGALTISPEGAMYLSRTDGHLFAKYNFSSLSGYDSIRVTPKANFTGLTFDDGGVLHGVVQGEESNLYTVNTTSGASTFKLAATQAIYDITGLNTDILPAFSRSLWTISRNGTSAQLVEVKNYDQATRSVTNWGNLTYHNGTSYAAFSNSSIQIYGLALSSSGVGYFVATGPTTISGSTYQFSLFKLDLATLQTGTPPRVTFMGDLKSRLDVLAPSTGTSESRWITGITIEPSTGRLYGMLLDGTSSGADYLFTINSQLKGSGNAMLDLSVVGRLTGASKIDHGKSIIFDRSGTLYAADYNDYTVDIINPATAEDTGTWSSSSDGTARYSAMAVDPVTGAIIGTEFSTTNTRFVQAGSNNDPLSFSFTGNLGISSVYAMSFLTWPVVLPANPPPVYYAANNTSTLYSFDINSGTTMPLSPVAPFAARSLAHDPQNRVLYYIENVNTGFRVAKFDLNSSTHTTLGNLDTRSTGSWSYDPSQRPNNLEYSGGSLYYIHPGTDDLVRVSVNATSILDQVKVADVTGNTSTFGGGVTELSIGADGLLWISAVDGLHKYNISLLNGFTTVSTGAQYAGIFFEQNGTDLYGTTYTQQTHIHGVNQGTGAMTAISSSVPVITFEDFGAYPPVPPAPVGTYYAVNNSRTLYLVDQLSGGVSAVNAGAPYDMSAVAFDVDNNVVYYTQGGTDTWSLGRYNPATGAHTDLGRAPESGTAYTSASGPQPENLFVFNSQVYYIKPGTDDLMRIDIDNAGTGLLHYYKVADISNNAVSFAAAGDVSVSSTGVAYFSTPSSLCRYDLRIMNGYAVVNSATGGNYRSLLMGADSQLYGIRQDEPSRIYRLNQSNGSRTFVADIGTGLAFTDLAGRHPRVTPQTQAGQVYMAVNNSSTIHLVNVSTAANRLLTSNALFNVGAIAYDYDSQYIYYTEASDSSYRLGRYDLRSSSHSIVADLASPAWDYTASARINNLLYSNGDLYYIHKNTDDLVGITLNNGSVTGQSFEADITSNTKQLGDIGATAIDENGYLYMSRQDAPLFARYNMARRSRYTELNTANAQFSAMTFFEGELFAARTAQNDRISVIDTAAGTVASTSAASTPAAAIQDLSWITPEFTTPSTRYYAANRTSTLYQINPSSGETTVLASVAPYIAEALAYDFASDYLYYLETPGQGFRLGRYDADSGTNLILGSLQQPGLVYIPADQPRSMVFYNGALYYIARNTDDLVQVNISGASIVSQVKVRDLSGNTASYDAAALALNNSGQLFFRTGSLLMRCDLRNSGASLTQISAAAPSYESLLFTEDSVTLYGAQTGSITRADGVNTSNATATTGTVTNPAVNLYEMTGPNSATAPASAFHYAANGTNKLYRIDPLTGATTALSGTAPYNFDSVAYDQTAGIVYFVEATDTSSRLGKYTISSGAFANIGQFVDTTISSLNVTVRPLNLVAYQGALYFVRASASTTSERDDLIRITFTTAGAIASRAKITDLTSATSSNVSAATVNDSGLMYFSAGANLYSYDLRSLSTLTLRSNALTQQTGLLWRRESAGLHSSRSSAPTTIQPVNMTTFAPGTALATTPSISITDMASGNTAPPPPWESLPPAYIAGDFSNSSNGSMRNVARLLPNGTIDPSFNPGSGANSGSQIRALTRTSNGQLIIGGDFTSFNGTSRAAIARLNGSGTLDTSFTPDISQQAVGSSGTLYNLDWSTTGFNQDITLNGTDTNLAGSTSPLHGMATGGGFAGFGYQTFNNVNSSGVSITSYFSQNMNEVGGLLDGALNGPNLFGPSGSGANGGIHPDRRVVGPWSLRFNNDQVGTIAPTTVGFSFSEPVFINQMLIGHLAKVAGVGTSFGANLLSNHSFESGSWTGSGWFPNSTDTNKKAATLNVSGGSTISNWSPDGAHWIQDSTRATDGSRLLYIKPSDQSWNFCVGQWLTVGSSPSQGRKLLTGRTYRVRYSAVTFNPNRPTGVGATQSRPAVEYGWRQPDGSNGFAELQNVREDLTGQPAGMVPATNWTAPQWRHYTGYFVAPAIHADESGMNLWLSQIKVDGATVTDTSGMLFDNVRLEEVLSTQDAFENVYIRAFSTADATGTPVAADTYANLSATTTNLLGGSTDPTTVADLNNVRMDSDTSNNVYHTIGKGSEADGRYGKISMSWISQPVRSIAISFWASSATTSVSGATPFMPDAAPSSSWTSTSNTNPAIAEVQSIVGYTGPLTELYKLNVDDGGADTGSFAGSYNIAYIPPADPTGASIVYTGGPVITGNPIYLHIKGGNAPAGQPSQYFYDISTWNRTDTLSIANYWPGTGSISHISIFGGSGTTTPPSGQPDPNGSAITAGVTASLSNLSFRRAAAQPGKVWALAEQPDGKILVGGNFTTVNGSPRKNIARLHANGTLDTTFDPGTGPDGDVWTIKITPDGSILAGGDFTTWNGSSAGARVVLLSSTGARNTGWNSPVSVTAGDTVRWIETSGSSVYIGGKFSTPRNGVAKLSMTGANDTAFNPGTAAGTATVHTGFIQEDGKVVVAGDFTSFNGTARNRIARLSTTGALDSTLAPSPGFDAAVFAMLRLPGSGYAHAGGAFNAYNGNTRTKVTVFNTVNGAAGTTTWGPTGMTVNAIYNIK
jgi:uncharacterized delta-60 repeat protein